MAHSARGKGRWQRNHPDAAAGERKRALDEDPSDGVARNQYILAMKRLNRLDEANAAAQRLREVLAQDRLAEDAQRPYVADASPRDAPTRTSPGVLANE